MSAPAPPPRSSFPIAACLLVPFGIFGAAAIWVLCSLTLQLQSPWFAFIATFDILLMLRLAGLRPSPWRSGIAMLATAISIACALWWWHAIQIGLELGFFPLESIPRMGAGFALTLTQLSFGLFDHLVFIAAIGIAGWLGR